MSDSVGEGVGTLGNSTSGSFLPSKEADLATVSTNSVITTVFLRKLCYPSINTEAEESKTFRISDLTRKNFPGGGKVSKFFDKKVGESKRMV